MRQFRNITSGIYSKYHIQIMILFVYTTTRKRFVIFTRRYFKLSWNTTALSQSNCRNFSCRSIIAVMSCWYRLLQKKGSTILYPLFWIIHMYSILLKACTNRTVRKRKLDLSIKGCLGILSKEVCKIWNSERNERCWKLNSASAIRSHLTFFFPQTSL